LRQDRKGWHELLAAYRALPDEWHVKGSSWKGSARTRFASLLAWLATRPERTIAVVTHHDLLQAGLGASFAPGEVRTQHATLTSRTIILMFSSRPIPSHPVTSPSHPFCPSPEHSQHGYPSANPIHPSIPKQVRLYTLLGERLVGDDGVAVDDAGRRRGSSGSGRSSGGLTRNLSALRLSSLFSSGQTRSPTTGRRASIDIT
jgi:hypothetical protein